MADLLSPRELLPNFLWMDSRIHPGNEKVIEHVGALGDEAGMIFRHRFDQAFDEFFAELLNHLGSAPRKESRGMARTGICAFPAVDDCPKPVNDVGPPDSSQTTGSMPPRSACPPICRIKESFWENWPVHRVTGGGRPPPVPTERSVRISRTTLFRR